VHERRADAVLAGELTDGDVPTELVDLILHVREEVLGIDFSQEFNHPRWQRLSWCMRVDVERNVQLGEGGLRSAVRYWSRRKQRGCHLELCEVAQSEVNPACRAVVCGVVMWAKEEEHHERYA
jgi:hypothetical protein